MSGRFKEFVLISFGGLLPLLFCLFLCTGFVGCGVSSPGQTSVSVPRSIKTILDNYYQLVEQGKYDDIYFTYVVNGTMINGQNYQGPAIDSPQIRAQVEGFWVDADQKRGKVNDYVVTKVGTDASGYTLVTIDEIRNGKNYEVDFAFLQIGKRWMLFEIRGL